MVGRCALLAGIAALLLGTGTAHAENVPSMYRGLWCLVGHQGETYRRCREADGEDYLEIQRSGIYGAAGDEESRELCEVIKVRPRNYSHWVDLRCPKQGFNLSVLLRLDRRNRLHAFEGDR
jgi:hypothetical protein